MSIRIDASWYRGLRDVRWTPTVGVSALVGQNGAGKSTLLRVPELVRELGVEIGVRKATQVIETIGGLWGVRHLAAPVDGIATVGVNTGALDYKVEIQEDGGRCVYRLQPSPGASTERYEVSFFQKVTVLDGDGARLREEPWGRSLLEFVESRTPALAGAAASLRALLADYRVYRRYDIEALQQKGSQQSAERQLLANGQNVFALLRNWRDAADYEERYEFVVNAMRLAFAASFRRFDFESAQTVVFAAFCDPANTKVPARAVSEGMITFLLHLCAVASTPPGGLVAIDEPENALSPYAIRILLEVIRRRAAQKNLTILLATHAPALLNHFREEPDNVWVLDPQGPTTLQRLTDLHDEAWLDRFSIGDLYAREVVGAPAPPPSIEPDTRTPR